MRTSKSCTRHYKFLRKRDERMPKRIMFARLQTARPQGGTRQRWKDGLQQDPRCIGNIPVDIVGKIARVDLNRGVTCTSRGPCKAASGASSHVEKKECWGEAATLPVRTMSLCVCVMVGALLWVQSQLKEIKSFSSMPTLITISQRRIWAFGECLFVFVGDCVCQQTSNGGSPTKKRKLSTSLRGS